MKMQMFSLAVIVVVFWAICSGLGIDLLALAAAAAR